MDLSKNKTKSRFIKIKDPSKPHHKIPFNSLSKSMFNNTAKYSTMKKTKQKETKRTGYLNTLKSTIKKVKSQIRKKSEGPNLRRKIRQKEMMNQTIDSKVFNDSLGEDTSTFDKDSKSMVILKVENGEEYPIQRDKFLSYCNNLGAKLSQIPSEKNVKILLPEWADHKMFQDKNFLSILDLKPEEAHSIFSKIKSSETIQKLTFLLDLFKLEDFKEILQSYSGSSTSDMSDLDSFEKKEDRIRREIPKTIQEVTKSMEQTEEDEVSLISFEECDLPKKVENKDDSRDLKVNNNFSLRPFQKSHESLKSFLRKDSPKVKTCIDENSLLKIDENKEKESLGSTQNLTCKPKLNKNNCLKSNFDQFNQNNRYKAVDSKIKKRKGVNHISLSSQENSKSKSKDRIFIEKSIDRILSNDTKGSTLKLKRKKLFRKKNERKDKLQKDIASILEASLLISKSNRSNSREKGVEESMKRCSSQENASRIATASQSMLISTNSQKSERLSKNEVMLLEKILEKDDEIKELRNRLDVFQYSNRLNYTSPYTSCMSEIQTPNLSFRCNHCAPQCVINTHQCSCKINQNIQTETPLPSNSTRKSPHNLLNSSRRSPNNFQKQASKENHKQKPNPKLSNYLSTPKYKPVKSQTAMVKDKNRSKNSSVSKPSKDNFYYGKRLYNRHSKTCMHSVENSGSNRDLSKISREDFGTKVVNFSMKDIDKAVQGNREEKRSKKESFSVKMKGDKENSGVVTLRSSHHTNINSSNQNSMSRDGVNVSSQTAGSKKRTAFINLKNLAESQSERGLKPQKENKVTIKEKENSEPCDQYLKGHLIVPKNLGEQGEETKMKFLSRKPSIPQDENLFMECQVSPEQIFNDEQPKSTHRTTLAYNTSKFEAPPESPSETETMCNYKNREGRSKVIVDCGESDSSMKSSAFNEFNHDQEEAHEVKYFTLGSVFSKK